MTWSRQPLKHLATVGVSNVDKKSADGEVQVRLVNYTDVYYGDRLTPSMDLMDATASRNQVHAFRLQAGDVVITKDSETADDIGIAAYVESSSDEMVLGYHLALLRPRRHVHGRFLYWAMCGDEARGQLATGATGVTRFGLRTDVISSVSLRIPSIASQRAIADFLDTETARIDALITKKRRMIDTIDEQWRAGLFSIYSASDGVRLKRLLARPLAYGVLVPEHVVEGIPMLRITDFISGRADLETVTRIPVSQSVEYRRTVVDVGDVIVSVVGTLGRSAVIDAELAGANLNRALTRIQLRPEVPPHLLRIWFASDQFTDQARLATGSGSAQATLNLGDLKNFDVGIPADPLTWKGLAARAEGIEERRDRSVRALRLQISLLQERRQALITVAVTGQLEVAGVAA